MTSRRLTIGAGLALALACGGAAGSAAAATVFDAPLLGVTTLAASDIDDAVLVQSGGTTVSFLQSNEEHEFFDSLQSVETPVGFTDATVFLTGATQDENEPLLFGLYSDGFTINDVNGHLNIYFISAGATQDEMNMFVTDANQHIIPETGQFQDVSSFFNQPAGFAQILSDIAIPEPSTWAMMLLGFGGMGAVLRRRRRQAAVPI